MATVKGDCVYFILDTETGTEECRVSDIALLDKAREKGAVGPDRLVQIFEQYRDEIERIARAKLARGEYDLGGILVKTLDLNK